MSSRRSFVVRMAASVATMVGLPKLAAGAEFGGRMTSPAAGESHSNNNHIHEGIYYFSGTGANDGYPETDPVGVTDPFEKHVTRTMDALKRSLEQAGCSMDSLLHLTVFLCLPLSDNVPMPTGKARFEAHKAQYDALNKIYKTYFSPGKAPSRACMALEWIPGDSLIEIVGSARVIAASAPSAGE
jgi:enamine deaminase RidA (YjgF/YER057c/UK114 family)